MAAAADETRAAIWASRLGWVILFAGIGAVLVTAGQLVRLAVPVADDLCRAGAARESGVGPSLVSLYEGWSGRWAGVGLMLILGRSLDLTAAYPWLLATVQLTVPAALYALLSAAFADRLLRPARAALVAGFIALHWAGSLYLADSYYWLTGAIENQLCLSLVIVILAALIRVNVRVPSRPLVGCLAGLAVVVTGIHELYGLFLLAALGAGTLLAFRRGSPARHSWMVIATATIVGLAVNLAAPGHAVRLAHNAPVHDAERLRVVADQWMRLVAGWATDSRLLLATLLVVGHPRAVAARPEWLSSSPGTWTAVGLGIAMGGVMLAAMANWWTFPTMLPGRTLSAIYFLFLIGWFLAAYAAASAFEMRTPSAVWAALAGFFVLALLGSSNYQHARDDLTTCRAVWFRAAVRDRDRAIQAAVAGGERNPRVAPISIVPTSFHYADVVDDPDHVPNGWCNDCYRAYYGLESIGLRATDPPPLAAADGPPRR